VTAPLTAPRLAAALAGIVAALGAAEEELNALDAELGDGDLGGTLASIAAAVAPILSELPPDVGAALAAIAARMASVSGSSFSGLIIIGLRKAGRQAKGKTEIAPDEIRTLLQESLSTMIERSGATLGDKTVLDGLAALANAAPGDDPLHVMAATLEKFRPLPCRMGRARIAGERSVGRDDPGMVALMRMVEGASAATT
jgi:phosphoenolpyruvate---glycerone phosphotransferase subunit DhaL